ncbi:hypothetical protein [Pseudorhodoferax sp. Leaf274]|uniref:hypothetical protein n=1 Tax=Pseudorhodoferax sp. Leaf274 TaxID=1736318 RepID=UPI0007034A57|nr:hypothetical protein [Pseudorhodoferax sp. Leaf274]KQP35862.1 hypothetical protein ASF44_21435 [Pseudorhodoferax sp. Leaf274]
MKLFQRKAGVAAAPTTPAAYGAQVQAFMAGLTLEDKARVVAATKTDHGDLELRMRHLKDGTQQLSLWLCLRGTDEALKLVPAPVQEPAA